MPTQNVLVLGGTGMLGAMVTEYLVDQPDISVTATARTPSLLESCRHALPKANWISFDAEAAAANDDFPDLTSQSWIVNAIGVIKPYIKDDDTNQVQRAMRVNGLFPHRLAVAAKKSGSHVLQIATDCVYSGVKGLYTEADLHDATDVYGKSKSLGEVAADNFCNLRCSIIGPELKEHRSLLDWFLRQPKGVSLKGFTNHLWNGVTTLQFARLCAGAIREQWKLSGTHHVVPADKISKYDLLLAFRSAFGRDDLKVDPSHADKIIDRTLETRDPDLNGRLWRSAGYAAPPTIRAMVDELAGRRQRLPVA